MEKMMTVPDYYEQFHCLGADCKYTCCQEWAITLTKNDYMKMRNLKASQEMQEKIEKGIKRIKKNSTDDMYAEIIYDENQLCPFLEKGLCSLQIECGYNTLTKICKSFPRLLHGLPDPIKSFSTGCEEVLNLLIAKKGKLTFHEIECGEYEHPVDWENKFAIAVEKRPFLKYHTEIRKLCIDILQNRSYSFDNRMILFGIAIRGMDELNMAKKFDELPEFIKQKQAFTFSLDSDVKTMTQSLDKLATNSKISAVTNIKMMFLSTQNGNSKFCKFRNIILKNLEIVIKENENEISYQHDKYENCMNRLKKTNYDNLFENIIVNDFFAFNEPFTSDNIWETYLYFAYCYSFMRFMVAGCIHGNDEPLPQNDLIQLLTACSRSLFHGNNENAILELKRNQTGNLAHMVIMIKG